MCDGHTLPAWTEAAYQESKQQCGGFRTYSCHCSRVPLPDLAHVKSSEGVATPRPTQGGLLGSDWLTANDWVRPVGWSHLAVAHMDSRTLLQLSHVHKVYRKSHHDIARYGRSRHNISRAQFSL